MHTGEESGCVGEYSGQLAQLGFKVNSQSNGKPLALKLTSTHVDCHPRSLHRGLEPLPESQGPLTAHSLPCEPLLHSQSGF